MKKHNHKQQVTAPVAAPGINIADFLFKFFFILCVFVSPLFFCTNLTRNPFFIQTAFLTFGAFGLLAAWGLKVFLRREIVLKYNGADILLLAFAAAALLSLAVNMLRAPDAPALFNEFTRRGYVFFMQAMAAYFIAKALSPFDGGEKEIKETKEAFPAAYGFLFWGLAWLLYPAFKMEGVFDIYAILVWGAGFWLCFKVLRKNAVDEACRIFMAVAALAAIYGIMQNLGLEIFWKIDISQEFGARAVSTFGNPNFLSSYIILILPLACVYFIKAMPGKARAYYFCLIILYSIFLVISMTRSSWLGAMAGLFVLFMFKETRAALYAARGRVILLFIAAALAFALWPARWQEGYKPAFAARAEQAGFASSAQNLTLGAGNINQSYHQRLIMWKCGIDMFKDAPLLGQGWGSYQLRYGLCQGRVFLQYPQLAGLRTQANSAHNEFVEVLAQGGLLGITLYLALFGAAAFLFIRNYKNLNPAQRLFYAALAAGCIAMLVDNLLNITMQVSVTAFAFWFIFSSLNMPACKTKTVKVPQALAALLLVFCAALLVFAGFWQTRRVRAEAASFEAGRAFAQGVHARAAVLANEALLLGGKTADVYYTLINSHIKTGNYKAAEAAAAEASKYLPHYHEFPFRLAAVKAAQGETAAVAENLNAVLKLYPSYYPAAKTLGEALVQQPQLAIARYLETLKQADGLIVFTPDIKISLAQIYLAKGDFTAAGIYARKALEIDLLDASIPPLLEEINVKSAVKEDALLEKAKAAQALKAQLKNVPPAFKNLENKLEALQQQNPGDLTFALLLGEYYYRAGAYAASAALLQKVYPNHKNDLPLNFALASAMQKLGRAEEAAFYLDTVLSLDPYNSTAAQRRTGLGF